MPFMQFLPWCPIDSAYEVGEIELVPYAFGADTPGLAGTEPHQVRDILAAYRGIDGRPIPKSTLVRYGRRPILSDVSTEEMDVTRELVELACVSGLAQRNPFDPHECYCNADCFVWYAQRFQGKLSHIGVVHRRRVGELWDFRSLDRTTFSIPLHVSSIRKVSLDSSLLTGLLKFRESGGSDEWGRWQNAISCFGQANTDSQNTSPQVESVLMCSAFQRLLDAQSKAKDVAQLFSESLKPWETILSGNSERTSGRQKDGNNPLRYQWMSEFYRVRGDFAHGKLQTLQPLAWTPQEHLVLASISFPLCMKSLLQQNGYYSLTDDDQVQIDAFEALANQNGFLSEPLDSSGSGDSWWRRCLLEA